MQPARVFLTVANLRSKAQALWPLKQFRYKPRYNLTTSLDMNVSLTSTAGQGSEFCVAAIMRSKWGAGICSRNQHSNNRLEATVYRPSENISMTDWNGVWGRGCDEADEEKHLFTESRQGIQ